MKKIIISLLLALGIFTTSVSNAVVALTAPLSLTSAVLCGVAGIVLAEGTIQRRSYSESKGSMLIFVGLVALDENRNTVVFSSMSTQQAEKVGLTHGELVSYNDQLALVNLTLDEMSKRIHPEMKIQELNRIYDETSAEIGLSDLTKSALKKIVSFQN